MTRDLVPVTMPMVLWHQVDGTLDNEVAVAAQTGDLEGVVDPASAIREAGWRQLAGWTSNADPSAGWPPPDEVVTMELTREQWSLVVRLVEKWKRVSDSRGDATAADDAVIELISRVL